MPQGAIRVLVADDHEAVRAGVTAVLSREPDIQVIGAVSSAEEVLRAAGQADVVVLDYRLPDADGARACARVLRHHPEVRVVVLSALAAPRAVRACVAAGARGFISKDADADEMPDVIRAVARGQAVYGAEVADQVLEWAQAAGTSPDNLEPVEVLLLDLLSQGCSNREIGQRIQLSEHTVKVRLRRLMHKLGVARRSEAVAAALRQGVI